MPEITDVTSDQDRAGPQANVVIDRVAAARLGVSVAAIDNALNNAFAQRQISIIYTPRNQYRVVRGDRSARCRRDPVEPRPHLRRRQQRHAGAAAAAWCGWSAARRRWRCATRASIPAATISFNTAPDMRDGRRA